MAGDRDLKTFYRGSDKPIKKKKPLSVQDKMEGTVEDRVNKAKKHKYTPAKGEQPVIDVTATPRKKIKVENQPDLSTPRYDIKETASPLEFEIPKFDKVESAQKRNPASNDTGWSDMLLGATPALLGLLTGNSGIGFEESSKLYGNLYKMRREDEKLARTLAGKRKSSGIDSAEWDRRQDRLQSDRIKLGERFGRGKGLKKDQLGQTVFYDKGKETMNRAGATDTFMGEPLAPKWIDQGNKMEQRFFQTVGTDVQSIKNSQKALALLNDKNPITGKENTMSALVALNMVPKITEARATDEDYDRTVKDISRLTRAAEFAIQQKNGRLAEKRINEAKRLFSTISGKVAEQNDAFMTKIADAYANGDARKLKYMKTRLAPYAVFSGGQSSQKPVTEISDQELASELGL